MKVRVDLTQSEAAALVDHVIGGDLLGLVNDEADRSVLCEQAAVKIRASLTWVRMRRDKREDGLWDERRNAR